MKKSEVIILITFILSIILSNLLIFFNKYDKLLDSIIRIHILANSNTKEDQLLKYKIKDEISSDIFNLLNKETNKEKAKNVIFNNLDNILKMTKSKVKYYGYNYDVKVKLTKSYFPTRKYDKFVLPAGKYDTLKIKLGKGKGDNWWCVAFPPMCSPIYSDENNNVDILGVEQMEMIKKPCRYKFAIVELITNIKKMMDNNK